MTPNDLDIELLTRNIANLVRDEVRKQALPKPNEKAEPEARTKLRRVIRAMMNSKFETLCEKYSDELKFIQSRDPEWVPDNNFFDL